MPIDSALILSRAQDYRLYSVACQRLKNQFCGARVWVTHKTELSVLLTCVYEMASAHKTIVSFGYRQLLRSQAAEGRNSTNEVESVPTPKSTCVAELRRHLADTGSQKRWLSIHETWVASQRKQSTVVRGCSVPKIINTLLGIDGPVTIARFVFNATKHIPRRIIAGRLLPLAWVTSKTMAGAILRRPMGWKDF